MSLSPSLALLSFLVLLLPLYSIFTSPVTLEDNPVNPLLLPNANHGRPHFANLSSPIPGQILYPGRPFRIKFVNGVSSFYPHPSTLSLYFIL